MIIPEYIPKPSSNHCHVYYYRDCYCITTNVTIITTLTTIAIIPILAIITI